MKIVFNGQSIHTKTATLHDLMQEQNLLTKTGIAVAVNQSVVQRSVWATTMLNENDTILVITATQGG